MTQFLNVPRRPLSTRHHKPSWIVRILLSIILACTAIISSISPARADSSQTQPVSGCRTYLTSASTWQDASQRSLGSAYRAIALRYASDDWMRTAMTCSQLRAQAITYSTLAQYELSHIAQESQLTRIKDDVEFGDDLSDVTQLLADHTSKLSLNQSNFPTDILSAFSHAEDRLRFSYDTIDGLSTSPSQYRSASRTALSTSQSFSSLYSALLSQQSSTKPVRSPRERVYSAQELVEHANADSTLVDKHTGTTMPVEAAIELDTALEELHALENSSAQLTSTTITPLTQSPSASNSDQWLIEVCCLITRHHMLRALNAGAPAISDLYLQ